jgi:predicted NAD-dependent protein-ADP-ribosyltransferase YbiA (DUF1768 family)
MITCSINNPEIVSLLYKHITAQLKASSKEDNFDHEAYLKDMYKKFAEATSPEVAAKYLQSVPRLIIDAANTYFEELESVNLTALQKLNKSFKADNGIANVIDTLSVKADKAQKKAEIKQKRALKAKVNEVPIPAEVKVKEPTRFQTWSPMSGTLQNFVTINPNKKRKGFVYVETVAQDKVHIIKGLAKIQAAQNMTDPTNGVVIDGNRLMFKASNLDRFATGPNYSLLDADTLKQIVDSRSIRKKLKEGKIQKEDVDPNIAQVEQRVILVVTNEFGQTMYFDDNGDITTKENGKPIYQFLRVARKTNDGKYTVRDIYNKTDQVLNPKQIARLTYNKEADGEPNAYLKMVENVQQEQMKELYDLQEKALKNQAPLLPITGITNGIPANLTATRISLKDLLNFPNMTKSVYRTIKTTSKGTDKLESGEATIKINGTVFKLDRPLITEDIATEIAQVLTNPKIEYAAKKKFVDQFLPTSLDQDGKTRKYKIVYDPSELYLYFNIYKDHGFKNPVGKGKNLSNNILVKAAPEELKAMQDDIVKVLMEGGFDLYGKRSFISYDNDGLASKKYLRYENGKFVSKSYTDFLSQSEADILITGADPGFYNYVVNFDTPESLLGDAIENTSDVNNKPTAYKNTKDRVVERLKEGEEISGKIDQFFTKNTLWDMFEQDGNQISFYNISDRKLTDADKGKTVTLVLNPEVKTKDGKVFTDVVQVYLGTEFIGNVAETDFAPEKEVKTPERVEKKTKEATEADIIDNVTVPGAQNPTNVNSAVGKIFTEDNIDDIDLDDDIFKGLDRKGFKKEFINPIKIREAKRWWNSPEIAPLRNLISLQHAANLVNSDVYATFIAHASNLADPNGKIASINVNTSKGSVYQNLTIYHESWHAFSQLFLTKDQKIALYNELKNYTTPEGNQPYATKSFRELEEMLAEDFRDYVKTGKAKKDAPKRNSIFRRIVEFFQQLFGKVLKKFNKKEVQIDSLNSPMAKELFDKLYLGKFNSYSPLIDNVMMYELDRGVRQVTNPREDALSPQDSELAVDSIDSIFSQLIDDIYTKRKQAAELKGELDNGLKAASIVMLVEPAKRAWMYEKAKGRLEAKLKAEQDKLESTEADIDFNSINTIGELKKQAAAVIKAKNGEDKYVFLASQIKDFTNLSASNKKGQRVRGENYYDTIKIVGDFYTHNTIKKGKGPADIIIVSKLADAEAQFENYKASKAKNFTKITINPKINDIVLTENQEFVRDNIRILQQILGNWGDEKSGMVKYHMEKSDYEIGRAKYEVGYNEPVNEEGEPVDEEVNVGTEEMNNDLLQGKLSLQQMMSKETTYLLKSLFKVNKDGSTPTNRLGFKERADFNTVFSILARTIGGERDRYVAYEKLKEESEKFPEIKQLFDTKYPNPSTTKNKFEIEISRRFLQDFGKPRIKYMQLFAFVDEDTKGYNFQVKESSLSIDNTLNRWEAGFKSSPKTEYISKTPENVSMANLNALVKKFSTNDELAPKDSIEFAKAIGIGLDSNDNIKNAIQENPDYYGLAYIFDVVKGFQELGKSEQLTATELKYLKMFVENPIQTLREGIPANIITTIKGSVKELTQLKRLAELQTKYGYDSATTAVIRANGNTAYQDMNWSTFAAKVYAINAVTDIKQLWTDSRYNYMSYLDPTINTHTRHLKMISSLFDDGVKIEGKSLLYAAVDGTSMKDASGDDVGNNTTELDPYSKFLQEFHTMNLAGVAEFPRTSEKKFSYGVKVMGGIEGNPVGTMTKGSDKNLYVDLNMFTKLDVKGRSQGEMYAVGNYLFGYLQGEFDRIKNFRGPLKDQYLRATGYNNKVLDDDGNTVFAGQVFSAFDNVLKPETKKALYQLAEEQIDVDLIDYLNGNQLKTDIVNEMLAYFNEKTQQLDELFLSKFKFISKSMFEKLGYKAEELTNQKLAELRNNPTIVNQLLKAYQYNDWIHKYESSIIMFGDHAQWNHDKEDWSKRIPGLTSDGTGFIFDEGMATFINDVFNKETYATKLSEKTGKEYDNYRFSETINTSVIRDAVRESIYLKDMIDAWREEYDQAGYSTAEIEKMLIKDAEAYEEMKEADGMAYMTLDAYRTLHETGRGWSLAQEELYQKIINGETVNPKTAKEYFPVYKLHYFGAVKNDILPITAMHKFAVIPLIPGVNAKEGSELDKLHKMMLKQDVQYVTFDSGSKGANLTADGTLDDIFTNDTDKAIKDKLDAEGEYEFQLTKNPIYLANLKEVTVINEHFKGELPIATQTRGIIIDNLYSNGEVKNAKNAELLNSYNQTIRDYTDILKEDLLNEVGFEFIDGTYVGNLTEFVEVIRRELENRDTPQHLVKLINTTEDRQLAMDLSLHPESDSIEKLLMSFVQKGLIKQVTNGEPLVQTPSTFTNGIWDTEYAVLTDPEEIKKLLGTNTLPFYIRNKGKRSTEMKVAVALQGDYVNLLNAKDLDGITVGDIDRLNELIKDPVWFEKHREALTMFGPRIPNDATSTIEAATVWHFLPEAFGNSIILPTEIVGKAGSDFDGDKLFMNMTNINSDGSLPQPIENFKGVLAQTKALEKEAAEKKEKLPEGMMSSRKLISIQKKYLQNKYKNLSVEILMLPENYAYLTKPNGTYLVDKYVEGLEKNKVGYDKYKNAHKQPAKKSVKGKTVTSPTRMFEAAHNLYVHEANLSLEPSLGIMAKLSKGHPIYKSIGAKMPASYRVISFNKALNRSIESGVKLPVVMRFAHNETTNSKGETVISLGGERTQLGTRISDVISHGLQGILDRAKNPFPFVLQLVPEGMDVFSYMIQAGVSEEEIFYFLNQPLVKQYFENQKIQNSAYYEILNPGKNATKSQAYTGLIEKVLDSQGKDAVKAISDKVNEAKLRALLDVLKVKNLDKTFSIALSGKTPADIKLSTLIKALNDKSIKASDVMKIALSKDDMSVNNYIYSYSSKLASAENYAFFTDWLSKNYLPNGKINMSVLDKAVQKNDSKSMQALAIFMNFIELEKQFRGMKDLQQQFSPDTAKLTTVQQVIKRMEMYKELAKSSAIDQDFLTKLFKESIISSFNQDELIRDIITPLFGLKLNDTVTDFINATLLDPTESATIRRKFGFGVDGQERFTNQFNNGYINSIFQNYQSNFTNEKGEFVNFPDVYDTQDVIVDDTIPYDAIVVKEGIAINTKQIEKDYATKAYLTINEDSDNYASRGLDTFTLKQDPFDTLASYYRYVIERAVLRQNNPIESLEENKAYKRLVETMGEEAGYESFLSEKALMKSFNYAYIMGKTKYSYTDAVMGIINEFENLNIKETYPILANLSPAPNKENVKILQLNNNKEAQGNLATAYYTNLKQLADRTIDKVNNRADNERISEIFNVFSLMMYYQHGVGKSKLSFNKVLDPAAYKNLMVRASQQFQNNYLNNESLSRVLAVVSNQARFKNYLVDTEGFRNKEYANTVVPVSKNSFEVPANFTPGKRVVFEEDVNAFLDRVSKNGGKKPNKHFTAKSTFSAFYNNGTGKREPMPQSAIWMLNDNGLYDMIDQDPESGEVYYQNVDLTTGLQMIDQTEAGEVNPINESSINIDEFNLADKLTPIEQNFKDGDGGRQMQPQFKGKSTMDLIIAGDRTRTTRAYTDILRMLNDYGLSEISELVGRVIRMTDKTGKQVYTRITNVAKFTQKYQNATWQKEGWEKSVTDKHVGDYPYAIEFEVVSKPIQSASNLPGPETTINIYAGKGENAELSNFAYRPFTVPAGNVTVTFNTVEGAFQAAKLGRTNSFLETKKLTPAQEKIFEKLQTATGAEAKKIGQAIKDLNKEKWDSFSEQIMQSLIRDSFAQNIDALQKLLDTGKAKLTHVGGKTDKWTVSFPRILTYVRDEFAENGGIEGALLSDYTMHSGGAEGADTEFWEIGYKKGLRKGEDYTVDDLVTNDKNLKQEIESAYQTAVEQLGRRALPYDWSNPDLRSNYAGGLVRRDYLQAKNSDGVFAISDIIRPGEKGKEITTKDGKKIRYSNRTQKSIVDGGTGYAVQMAFNLGKPVYVFHQGSNVDNVTKVGWYKLTDKGFVKTDTPLLTEEFAGIGTRQINEAGKQAIADLYDNLINNLKAAQKVSTEIEGPVKDERTIEEDMMMFQELVKANKGELPKSFMSGSRKWTINQYGNYDLVDATTGDIYQRNVNMETGLSEPEASQEETLDPAKKESALAKIQDMVKNQQLAEQLAIIGYDVKDLLNNLVKAKTMEEYNKVMEILDKLC